MRRKIGRLAFTTCGIAGLPGTTRAWTASVSEPAWKIPPGPSLEHFLVNDPAPRRKHDRRGNRRSRARPVDRLADLDDLGNRRATTCRRCRGDERLIVITPALVDPGDLPRSRHTDRRLCERGRDDPVDREDPVPLVDPWDLPRRHQTGRSRILRGRGERVRVDVEVVEVRPGRVRRAARDRLAKEHEAGVTRQNIRRVGDRPDRQDSVDVEVERRPIEGEQYPVRVAGRECGRRRAQRRHRRRSGLPDRPVAVLLVVVADVRTAHRGVDAGRNAIPLIECVRRNIDQVGRDLVIRDRDRWSDVPQRVCFQVAPNTVGRVDDGVAGPCGRGQIPRRPHVRDVDR